jgi:hypothetical protein
MLCDRNSTTTSRTGTSSSVVSVSIESAHETYWSFLQQGEQICKDLEQGDCIRVQTSTIDLQFSWSRNCSRDTSRSVGGTDCYRIRVKNLEENSELTRDTRTVDVKRLRYDQSEAIWFSHFPDSGRIVCYNGKHRLLLICEKVNGAGALA